MPTGSIRPSPDPALVVDAEARARARADSLDTFEAFCFHQRRYIREQLRQVSQRLQQARQAGCDGPEARLLVICKGVTTGTSGPVRREYQDQAVDVGVLHL